MAYYGREITCIVCGEKIIDRSTNQTRKFCSDYCAQADYRRRHGVGVKNLISSCIYNQEVGCMIHKCSTCGWNPKVERRRKEALSNG